jgi:DNA-binding transcriptional ArsR family regulator
MVEYTINLDLVFASLGNATRRDILNRVSKHSVTVGDLASTFKSISLAAVAKHIEVLERAELVVKKREGRRQFISANPKAMNQAAQVLQAYKTTWDARFDTLDKLLK